ncbi:FkbM family methyltransferase [Polynucleobacter hallstattensis]|uniref:FkbM family methyltransferase n=1 Tax=Polynucleobacter hallstattensis TaxID=1855586 RepID=UPI001C0D9DFB|nr:FkbM family methyltransferase [Polynucleobacter hallstattensis]MBU3560446.1 FkbM family methyltransferase [Polynucleobacter hallstattensis]
MVIQNNNLTIEDAIAYRNQHPNRNNYSISELTNLPKFFDWVNCNPSDNSQFSMYLAGADDGVVLRFFWNGRYEYFTLKTWSNICSKSKVIVDIGAHTGAYTLTAASTNSNASIFAYEPHFMNFARLNLNLRRNGFNANCAHMLGVGERNEMMPFSISTDISYLSTGGSIGARNNSHITPIQVVKLDDFFPQNMHETIDLIKIDVEGFEGSCLRGMSSILNRGLPTIFFECIDHTAGSEVFSELSPLGYSFYEIDDLTCHIKKVEDIKPIFDDLGKPKMNTLNRIAVKNESLQRQLDGLSTQQ